jgi:hypothetical protein
MTPLIREFVAHGALPKKRSLDPSEFKWFDITPSINNYVKVIAKIKDVKDDSLPFPQMIVVGQANVQKVMTFALGNSFSDGGVCVGGIIVKGQKVITVPTLFYMTVNGSLCVTNKESIAAVMAWKEGGEVGPPPEMQSVEQTPDTFMCACHLAELLRALNHTPVTGYVPSVRPGYVSSKRISKGKLPLYDWTTVVIDSPKPKSEYQGGTHASPRHHERRGHFRNTPSGKRVWVRNHKVGNPANGTVFHDYQLRS